MTIERKQCKKCKKVCCIFVDHELKVGHVLDTGQNLIYLCSHCFTLWEQYLKRELLKGPHWKKEWDRQFMKFLEGA